MAMALPTLRAFSVFRPAHLRIVRSSAAFHALNRVQSPSAGPETLAARSLCWFPQARVHRCDRDTASGRLVARGDPHASRMMRLNTVPTRSMSGGSPVSWLSTTLSKRLSKMGAFKKVKEAAEKGDAKAMTLMGVCYGMGRDVEQDDTVAAEWFKKAADAGNGEACLAYGIWALDGKGGIERSPVAAVKYLETAEKAGVVQAQTVLGIIYMSGDEGVVRDNTKAVKLFSKAAEAGDAQAMHNLGLMLVQGLGAPVSLSRGTDWVRRAATAGVVESQFTMHCWYRDGTRALKQNHKKSFEWAVKAANQGYDQAMHNVGAMYDEGVGVAESKVEAMKWYKQAMELGVADSAVNLGKCLITKPDKTTADAEAGLELFVRGAEQGNSRGQWNAAVSLWNLAEELGLPQDAARSLHYLEKAADQGHEQALQELSRRYAAGEGVEKDMDKAVEINMRAQELRKERLSQGP